MLFKVQICIKATMLHFFRYSNHKIVLLIYVMVFLYINLLDISDFYFI